MTLGAHTSAQFEFGSTCKRQYKFWSTNERTYEFWSTPSTHIRAFLTRAHICPQPLKSFRTDTAFGILIQGVVSHPNPDWPYQNSNKKVVKRASYWALLHTTGH